MYTPDRKDRSLPYVSPLLAPDLSALPAALVVTAGCDPLRDEGEAYALRLAEAGVRATYVCFEDMIHAFLLLFKRSRSRERALDTAAAALRDAFGMAKA
jgi:acetyl esterase